MSLPEVITWAAVIVVGGLAAFRNPSAAVLVLAWMANLAVQIRTGDPFPLWFYLRADIAAIALIMCKAEQTLADRTVLALFPLCWIFYISGIPDYHLFYALWAISLTQFLVVGWETALPFIRRTRAVFDASSDLPGGFQFAWAVRGYG